MTVVPATYAPGHPDYSASVSKEQASRETSKPSAKKVSSPGPAHEGAAAKSQRSGT